MLHLQYFSHIYVITPLNAQLNPICHLLALLGAHHIFHVSGLRVKTFCPSSGVPKGGGFNPPLPETPKANQNRAKLNPIVKTAEFRTPTPQDVWKKGSKILKLPSVRNCFTLAMTNKLVVIINSLKVPKIKEILRHEMKFLVRNYSCLQNP